MKRTTRNRTLLAALALTLAWSFVAGAPLFAQRVTGQISGTVSDEQGGALPGVTVSLLGSNIVGTQSAITTANGFYRFVALPPGAYELRFNLDGFSAVNRTGVRVGLGQTSIEDVALKVGDVTETITVTAEAPLVDTQSNEIGANFGRDWVENAPTQRQSFNDLVAAAPGSVRGGDQSRRTMVYGSSYDENSFQLDGADVNDNFFNEQLAQPNIDAIEEVEVLSLGAPAEYGNLTGAVYNIVTRQGTNQFHGDVNIFSQGDGLTSKNTNADQDDGFPFLRDEYNDWTVQLGGPIAKDRVWFFASYQRQDDGYSNTGVDPAVGLVNIETDRYFGKFNVQITPRHKIQFTYHQDDQFEPYALGASTAQAVQVARAGHTPTPGLGYTGVISDKSLIEVRFTGFYGDVFLAPKNPSIPRDTTRFIDLDTGQISGGHYYWYDLFPERTTINTKVSYLADNFLGGSHDFRFGFQYNDSEAGGIYGYNDLVLTYSQSYPGYGYGYTRAPFSYSGNAEGVAVFVDDTWRVNDRLSVNLGVRYDKNDAFSKAQQELDQFGAATGVTFAQADYYSWKYVSPRLGLNYQLTADGKTVLKAHVGRYHRAITTGEFANVIGPSIKPIFAGGYDTGTNTFFDLFQITDNSNLLIDPNYKSPQTDQYIVSVERQFGRNYGLALNLVRKEGSDFGAWKDIAGVYEDATYVDDRGADATGKSIGVFRRVSSGADSVFQITNRAEMDNEITAASLDFHKRMENHWSVNASLTFLESSGRTPDSNGGASIQQRGGLQFRTFGRNPNDFVNSGGRLRGDVPWQFKTQFVYELPKGFLVSASVSSRAGANLVRRVSVPRSITNISATILAEERGESGRLPSQTIFDLRLQKDFTLRQGMRLGLIADIFNVSNDDANEGVRSTIGTSSSFNVADGFILPRRVMLGAKLRF